MDLRLRHEHRWDVSVREAIEIQQTLVKWVREEPIDFFVETVAGIDVSIRGDLAQAAVSVIRLGDLAIIDEAVERRDVPFPYVPGLLSFREIPAILPALERLHVRPDILMTDSQGLAHPRRFGLACHLGVLLDWPTLGVAKSRLIGAYEEPGQEKGQRSPLFDSDEVIGSVVRTRTGKKPVYVSIGHQITLEEAVRLTLACTSRYKIPEPTRQAHHLSRREQR